MKSKRCQRSPTQLLRVVFTVTSNLNHPLRNHFSDDVRLARVMQLSADLIEGIAKYRRCLGIEGALHGHKRVN